MDFVRRNTHSNTDSNTQSNINTGPVTTMHDYTVRQGHFLNYRTYTATLQCRCCTTYCWFSVLRHSKIDQNKNQNRSKDKDQNLGNERRYIYKDPCQDSGQNSGQRNISYTRYLQKCFTQTYRDLYGDAMLVLTWMSSNMADGNQQKYLLRVLLQKPSIYSSRNS